MPKATETKMKWYICLVPCTLENLKKKRSPTLKTGKTAVASGQTQPIADYVDDRPHDIQYIDYVYQDFPGLGGSNAPAHLIGYYGAANIKETTYAEAPPVGIPLHLLDSKGEMLEDEEIYKKGFDKSGFPIFWDGETYIKEKKLYLQHLNTPFTRKPRYFNDLIPDPNTSNSGQPKDVFEKYNGNTAADKRKIAIDTAVNEMTNENNWIYERSTFFNRHLWRASAPWYFRLINELGTPNDHDNARKVATNVYDTLSGKPNLFMYREGNTVYPLNDFDLQSTPEGYADQIFDDDDLQNIFMKEDHRGIVDFWRLFKDTNTGISLAEWNKLVPILQKIGYGAHLAHVRSKQYLVSFLKGHNSGNRFLPNGWGVFREVAKAHGGDNGLLKKVFAEIPAGSTWSIRTQMLGGGSSVWAILKTTLPVEYVVYRYFMNAKLALSRYIQAYYPPNNPRRGGIPASFEHIFQEKNEDKLITHKILETLHMQTRKKPYVPKNPVTHDPGVHVDAATHEKISHNIHDAVMKKKKKTAYTYQDHKPKDSKSVVIEQDEIKKIMKPHEDYLLKHSDPKKKTTIWDL